MACYAYKTLSQRRTIQKLWESGMDAKGLSAELNLSLSAVYAELKRGYDGSRMPDCRRHYDAELAQLRMQQGLEKRGRKAGA